MHYVAVTDISVARTDDSVNGGTVTFLVRIVVQR
jgi:hypothetical protein